MRRDHRARALCLAAVILAPAATTASAACIPDAFPGDYLQQQEAAGGHTLARHVGRTDAELVRRLRRDRRVRNASTYLAAAGAQADITGALAADRSRINAWAADAPYGATRAWDAGRDHIVGRVAARPPGLGNIADASHLRVVVRKTGATTCLLLTSFPIPDRDE
jgi:Bacterial CdiA-CT RNAse A domain